jgi:hypothetical protein
VSWLGRCRVASWWRFVVRRRRLDMFQPLFVGWGVGLFGMRWFVSFGVLSAFYMCIHVVWDFDYYSFLYSFFYSIGETLGCCLVDLFVYSGFCRLSAFVGA